MAELHHSVLDLAPVIADDPATDGSGSDTAPIGTALHNSVRLAQEVEKLGYHRFWLAEHHSMPGIASAAPAIVIGQVAAATSTLRVGSGGVMLPNHAPLVVAEQFGTLDALFPGRIDLGLGRAPGTDQVTMHALRRPEPGQSLGGDDFPAELASLRAFLTGGYPDDHPYSAITATPGLGADPEIWLLGSSTYSAQLAAMLGLPFAFARHFAPQQTMPAMQAYRDHFRPGVLEEPHAMITVTVIAADDDAEAQYLAGSQRLAMARLRTGAPGRYPTAEEAARHPLTPLQESSIAPSASAWIVGGPERVADQLGGVLSATGANEIMINSTVADFDARVRSHRIVAEVLRDLAPAAV
ncbi:LLM class flavin-dependent oxidoreductase [Williamsia sterculiae]|uniref:LLM class flavin-dependent oxidoreductase n=1 Tax=Williamsia sterculiae TaxID=1344003 RepID=UPI00097139DA|nr:LLM class flavin-dependent oxidoreductase [Williamsia sterculiae]